MIVVKYGFINTGNWTKHEFAGPDVEWKAITAKANELNVSSFHVYENGAMIGYGTKFADGWNYSENTY